MPLALSKFLVSTSFTDSDNIAKRIIYQTRTGQRVLISEKDWLKLESHGIAELSNSLKKILLESEILIESERDEIKEILEENNIASQRNTQLYQVIMPTAACQLACNDSACASYCGQTHSNQLLGVEEQELLLERLRKEIKSASVKSLRIAWFGGEPLLGISVIRNLSPKLIRLAQDNDCIYSAKIVTNGLALTLPVAKEICNQYRVTQIEITLDGTADYHDQRRVTKHSFSPTFHYIFSNLLAVASANDLKTVSLSVRCNVDKRNKDGVIPLIEEFQKHDLFQRLNFYVASVHPWGNDVKHFAMSSTEFAEFEMEVFTRLIQLGSKVRLLPSRKLVNCLTTQKNAGVVDPFGVLHNCSETALVKNYERSISNTSFNMNHEGARSNKYAIGTLYNGIDENSKGFELGDFNKKIEASKVPCSKCSILPVCGGSCPLQWEQNHSPCPPIKFNIESRLLLQYALEKETLSTKPS